MRSQCEFGECIGAVPSSTERAGAWWPRSNASHSAITSKSEIQAALGLPPPRRRGWQTKTWLGAALTSLIVITAFILVQRFYRTPLWRRWPGLSLAQRAPPLPKLPWRPLFSEEELQQGVTYYGGGERLRRVAAKLAAGQPIKAVTLGGSVTFGHGVDDPALSYPSLFFRFINESFPHRDHLLSNRGMPGSTSAVAAPCAQSMIGAPDPDLLILEFSVNDSPAGYASPARAAFEGLLRQLLALPSRPALALLHHYPWWKAEGDGAAAGLFYREPEGQLTLYSHYYDIPSLSLRSAAWRLMQAGVEGFKVDRLISEGNRLPSSGALIPTAEDGRRGDYFYLDTIHPGPNGHKALAELLSGLLQRAVAEVAAGTAPARRDDPRLAGLPPPLAPAFEEERPSLCLQLEAFKGAVVRQQGFQYRPEKPALPSWVEQKWGWGASQPGAWAELELDTRPGPGTHAARTSLQLSHLRSHDGMGTARVACVSGCACQASTLDGTTASHVSVFKVHPFKVSRHPRCRIRVTVLPDPGQTPQEGHKVLLAAAMVTHRVAREHP